MPAILLLRLAILSHSPGTARGRSFLAAGMPHSRRASPGGGAACTNYAVCACRDYRAAGPGAGVERIPGPRHENGGPAASARPLHRAGQAKSQTSLPADVDGALCRLAARDSGRVMAQPAEEGRLRTRWWGSTCVHRHARSHEYDHGTIDAVYAVASAPRSPRNGGVDVPRRSSLGFEAYLAW